MKLEDYLKKFDNIAWYPSGSDDFDIVRRIAVGILQNSNFSDLPDCFIITDTFVNANVARKILDYGYDITSETKIFFDAEDIADSNDLLSDGLLERETRTRENIPFLPFENSTPDNCISAKAFNRIKLDRINLGTYEEQARYDCEHGIYGMVVACDLFIKHSQQEEYITKLIYVFSENAAFAKDFLLENNIKIKTIINTRYGHDDDLQSSGGYIKKLLPYLGTEIYIGNERVDDLDNDKSLYSLFTYLKEGFYTDLTYISNLNFVFETEEWPSDNKSDAIIYKVEYHTKGFFSPNPFIEEDE